ncbi:MFS transporter [Streptomyces sp. NPDC050504]|uniref:MFS transporter n=1 Tax=Streptomyces sp. NPDC050504 TaxID=3365618 RepID=UPI00379341F8
MTGRQRGGLLRRHRDFRLLWGGEVSGKFGAAVTAVAMPLAAVSVMDAGTFQVSLLSAATWLPWLVIGLPAGAWVDRLPKRPVMLWSALACLLLFLGLRAAAWAGHFVFGWLLAVALLTGVAAVFFQIAYTAYLPTLLDTDDLAEGNAKLHGSASAAQIVGQGGGGFLVQAVGPVNGLLTNAGTFAMSLVCLLGIRHREPRRPSAESERAALLPEVRAGLRLVAHDPWFRAFALYGALANLCLMGYQSILVVFLVHDVDLDPGSVGGLIAVANTGGIIGALIARRVSSALGTSRATLVFALVLTAPALLVPLTFPGPGVALYAVGGMCAAAGVVAINVVKAGFQQRYCPPELLGRLSASSYFLNYGALPVGALVGGGLGSVLGVRTALWILVCGVPLSGLVLFFSPLRHCRELPTETARPPEVRPVSPPRA